MLGRDTSDIFSSGPIISLWDESKTTILRVTARHSGVRGVGWGQGKEEETEVKARGTHSFTPHFPQNLGLFQTPGLCPRGAPVNLADWKARHICLQREGYLPKVISCVSWGGSQER